MCGFSFSQPTCIVLEDSRPSANLISALVLSAVGATRPKLRSLYLAPCRGVCMTLSRPYPRRVIKHTPQPEHLHIHSAGRRVVIPFLGAIVPRETYPRYFAPKASPLSGLNDDCPLCKSHSPRAARARAPIFTRGVTRALLQGIMCSYTERKK